MTIPLCVSRHKNKRLRRSEADINAMEPKQLFRFLERTFRVLHPRQHSNGPIDITRCSSFGIERVDWMNHSATAPFTLHQEIEAFARYIRVSKPPSCYMNHP